MVDDSQTQALPPAGVPSTASASDPSQKSPLDVLEELLKNAKTGSDAQKADVAAPTVAAPTVAAPTESQEVVPTPSPDTHSISPDDFEVLEALRKAEDEAAAAAKLREIQLVQNTPEYQARVQQDLAAEELSDQMDSAQAGFEITQLDHIKIP